MKNIDKAWKAFDKGFQKMSESFKQFDEFNDMFSQKKKSTYLKYVISKISQDDLGYPKTWYLTTKSKWFETLTPKSNEIVIRTFEEFDDAEIEVNNLCVAGHTGVFHILKIYKK